MRSYYIKSIIGEIAKSVERLMKQKAITKDKRVLLYGVDRYSFAMRTILSNLGYSDVEGYLSDDESLVLRYQSEIKDFACRFLNRDEDIIQVWTVEERLRTFDDRAVILLASKDCERQKKRLEALGYEEHIHFYIIWELNQQELEVFLGGKTRMALQEIKETEKEILAYVDRLCEKKGLRYWVCGGTLLGTIRHKGFIPWDDDIDIFLPWQDYQRFMEEFEETDRFGVMGFGTAPKNDFPDLLAKIVDKRTTVCEDIGTVLKIYPLWIDVFPLIGLPDDADERRVFFAGYRELNRRIWQDFYGQNGSVHVFSKWYQQQRAFLDQYDFDKASYVGVLGTAYGERDHTTKHVYEKTLRMGFEDIEVNVPAGYKEYLDNLYGSDWMELPPKEKRKTHHNVTAYWNGKEIT
jgi:lipopolysaccharide cholinephosphotransferase